MRPRRMAARQSALVDDPLWYKDAILYELRVRSYNDANGDGIGDFAGLSAKLDYLADLGVSALWLLPICPSPGRDDGYDIADYTDVHPDVGTLDDFRQLLDEAHRRGLRIITELVLNHTSDQHPWFQRARRAPKGSPEREFYVWSDTPERYTEARIIFKDFEPSNWSWDPVAHAYYWHRFFSHQPDLNFDNPAVQEALLEVVDFWFGLGVDGLRLDAVPYLYEREGTSCENLAETHVFLRRLRAHVDSKFKNRMLLAEANQWPEDAAAYYGTPDGPECHMNFHFPIMPRIFMSLHMEDRLPIIDILQQTPQLDERCQWALFLRNHDELTLEMVTDEERDYMYRAFAKEAAMRINLGIRRRLAPLLGNDRRRIELVNGLLFSLPGTPVVYYGDEIAMGDNVFLGDRNGVRTPMQWSADRNAGFSRCNPQRLILPIIIDPEYHYESLNVEAQQQNPNSLLWWMKRLIALRKRYQAFGRGSIEFLSPDNPHVLAFLRQLEGETVLVVANLSRHVQYVELDLARMKGKVPVELFGRTPFPAIGDLPYLLTLGEHAFYWFDVGDAEGAEGGAREASYQPPTIDLPAGASGVSAALAGDARGELEVTLADYLAGRRWYVGQPRPAGVGPSRPTARDITAASIVDDLALGRGPEAVRLLVVRLDHATGDPEQYTLPVVVVEGERAAELRARSPQAVIANLASPDRAGPSTVPAALVDVLADPPSAAALLDAWRERPRVRGAGTELWATLAGDAPSGPADPRPLRGDHQHATVTFGESYLLKFFRRVDEGTSTELEVGRHLARPGARGAPVAPLLGALEYRAGRGEPITLALLLANVPNEGTAWVFTRESLRRYFEPALAAVHAGHALPPAPRALLEGAGDEPVPAVQEVMGNYLAAARLLGARTAELHLALAAGAASDGAAGAAFTPEPYTALDQRSFYQSKRNLTGQVLRLVRQQLPRLAPPLAELARELLDAERALYRRYEPLLDLRFTGMRTRIHGDYHLDTVLYTGKDFVVADFAGDVGRPLAERRRKRSALRDVASMVRSFEYAAHEALSDEAVVRAGDRAVAAPWARLWVSWASATFARSYLERVGDAPFLPRVPAERALMMDALLIEKGLEELASELARGRAPFVEVAIRSVLALVER